MSKIHEKKFKTIQNLFIHNIHNNEQKKNQERRNIRDENLLKKLNLIITMVSINNNLSIKMIG